MHAIAEHVSGQSPRPPGICLGNEFQGLGFIQMRYSHRGFMHADANMFGSVLSPSSFV